MNLGTGTFLAAFGGLLSLAALAVILSQRAQTSKVLQALGTSTSQVIGAAVAPVVTGGTGTTG